MYHLYSYNKTKINKKIYHKAFYHNSNYLQNKQIEKDGTRIFYIHVTMNFLYDNAKYMNINESSKKVK